MATFPRPTAWQDWAVPAFLFLWAQVEIWLTGLSLLVGPPWMYSLVAFGCALALTFRRIYAISVALTVTVLLLAPLLMGWMVQAMSILMMLVVAVFACGRYAQRPAAYLAIPMAAGAVLLVALVSPEMDFANSWAWSLNALWIFGLGAAFRHEHHLRQQVAEASAALAEADAARYRLRTAREIHDVLSHSLAVVVVQAEVADIYLRSDDDKSRQAIRNVAATARSALNDTRKIVGLLRDPDEGDPRPTQPGLADVPGLVNRVRESGLPVSLLIGENPPLLTAQINSTTYRIVQESLTNVLRHAGPVPTQVDVQFDPDRVIIEVLNSPGHHPVNHQGHGHGLLGMHERVLECGGELTSGPDPIGGFAVRAVLPVTAA